VKLRILVRGVGIDDVFLLHVKVVLTDRVRFSVGLIGGCEGKAGIVESWNASYVSWSSYSKG